MTYYYNIKFPVFTLTLCCGDCSAWQQTINIIQHTWYIILKERYYYCSVGVVVLPIVINLKLIILLDPASAGMVRRSLQR